MLWVYRMSESEFAIYEMAEQRLYDLKKQHTREIEQAYDGIHPTRTGYDFDQGRMFSESLDPAEYAIYIIDLKEEHERTEKWWRIRADAFREACVNLSEEERCVLGSFVEGGYIVRQRAREKVRLTLSELVSLNPSLQRNVVPLDDLEDIEEIDRRIDNMSMKELMEDYWDTNEQGDEKRLREQCIRMYEVHDMTCAEIGKVLGVITERVKSYCHKGVPHAKAN